MAVIGTESVLTREMLLEAMEKLMAVGEPGQIFSSPRRHGKSAFMPVTNAIQGKQADYLFMDEDISSLINGEIARFANKEVPDATIVVCGETLDKHHHRNPNPHAGEVKVWQVYHGRKAIGRPFMAKPIAVAKAEDLHRRMVEAVFAKRKELEDERQRAENERQIQYKVNPDYGRF